MASPLNFPKLPPLKALRGFESTARLYSFRKAAEELNLTHPAISHQVQSLEKNLGVKLFVREGRQAVLTPEGERFYPVAREALEILIAAVKRFVVVPANPFFAYKPISRCHSAGSHVDCLASGRSIREFSYSLFPVSTNRTSTKSMPMSG